MLFTRPPQPTIAMVYDFDGTLTPRPMQDDTILPLLGVAPGQFWATVDAEVAQTAADPMLVYMRRLLERMAECGRMLGRQELRALGARIRYFPGVEGWFERLRAQVTRSESGTQLRNYVVSAGHREILEGVTIRSHFARVYASEYHFDRAGRPTWPNRVVNDTAKTQYLFRINKGREDLRDSINTPMPAHARAIPFSQMVYIGDGLTDVPGMAVTKKHGGHAVAVYRPGDAAGMQVCRALLEAGRIDFHAPADFRAGSLLDRRVRLLLDTIVATVRYRETLASSGREASNAA